ncbi:MAG: Flp pilus assembly complex ATPase component TadA [Hyphomonas sp.]|jgi:type IV secretion system protein VirB11|nr:Flp pilus assembly complex ATPase component TadA [Hyphomonas sp.]
MSYLATYLGRLDPVLLDPTVIEVSILPDGTVWAERAGDIHMAPAPKSAFPREQVRDLAAQIANSTNNRFTETSPLVSATVTYQGLSLRAQIVGTPASPSGTTLSFRVFRPEVQTAPRTFEFLQRGAGNSDEEHRKLVAEVVEVGQTGTVDALLKLLVAHRFNVIVSGGTSTGKTELGRRLLDLVHDDERIVTIEDSLELRPRQRNSVCLLASREEGTERSANHLLQATLRLRPDRIILGELRGLEAATFLDAINTGHAGSFTTIHAQSARKALDRLALLVMASGTRLGYAEVIRYLEGSIDVIVQMGRDGEKRGVVEVWMPGSNRPEGASLLDRLAGARRSA